MRSLGDNAITVLGNHDLHLLAVAFATKRKIKSGDTVGDVLDAQDRDELLEWLLSRPPRSLRRRTARRLLVHAGLVPQWSARNGDGARSAKWKTALRKNPRALFDEMYGDQPDRWSDSLKGMDRLRFAINALTRLRVCTREGKVELKMKGAVEGHQAAAAIRGSSGDHRASRDVRVIFGHWSALGLRAGARRRGARHGLRVGRLAECDRISIHADAPTGQHALPQLSGHRRIGATEIRAPKNGHLDTEPAQAPTSR